MQKRHSDRLSYFEDSAYTAREFYLPYTAQFHKINTGGGVKILEVGCGEGGNLLPFAEQGCEVSGIDLSPTRIAQATAFFRQHGQTAQFIHTDFLEQEVPPVDKRYDILLIHDVIEHISRKADFIRHAHDFLAPDGIIFWGFPAWQMPFGGHQQICQSRLCSHLPFIHLLPEPIYDKLLQCCGEKPNLRKELLEIKRTRMTIEHFENLLNACGGTIIDRTLWLINPHYKRKFNLRPQKLPQAVSRISYLRNFFSTACFYITQKRKESE